MRLAEEYLDRHSVKIPQVKHTRIGFIFLKQLTDSGMEWQIIENRWNEPANKPGFYQLFRHRPYCRYGEMRLEKIKDEEHLNCIEFEDYMVKMATNLPYPVVSNPKEVLLTAWEIFAYLNPLLFTNCSSNNLLFNSLNFNLGCEERYRAQLDFLDYFKLKRTPSSFRIDHWYNHAKKYLDNYSYWFADFCHEKTITN